MGQKYILCILLVMVTTEILQIMNCLYSNIFSPIFFPKQSRFSLVMHRHINSRYVNPEPEIFKCTYATGI